MKAPDTHACESRFRDEQSFRRGQSFPSFELASKAMKEVTDHLAVCPTCRAEIAETRIVELDVKPAVPAAVLDLKARIEGLLGAGSVRILSIDDLPKPAPAPPKPEQWGIFIDTNDGQGMLEDKGSRVATKDAAERQGRMTEQLARVLGLPVPRWEARRVDIATPGPEDVKVDVPAMLDKIASLEARASTLVESEARAVAGEKAAREALEAATAKIAELTACYAARREDAPAEPAPGAVDHGPNGVGC